MDWIATCGARTMKITAAVQAGCIEADNAKIACFASARGRFQDILRAPFDEVPVVVGERKVTKSCHLQTIYRSALDEAHGDQCSRVGRHRCNRNRKSAHHPCFCPEISNAVSYRL